MAIRTDFRFGTFVSEYCTLRPDAFIFEVYGTNPSVSLPACVCLVTMRPVIFKASAYPVNQRRRRVVIKVDYPGLRLRRADYLGRHIISELQSATFRIVGPDFSKSHALLGAQLVSFDTDLGTRDGDSNLFVVAVKNIGVSFRIDTAGVKPRSKPRCVNHIGWDFDPRKSVSFRAG
jgi:hypothetical protein